MSDIFISYSRKDIAYARLLHEALKENDIETWIDWQDIPPSTEWLKEVYTAIEEANTFVFILSVSSVLSDVCAKEIEHARENNKRMIPIVIDDINPSKVHPALAAINWIFSRTKDELSPAIDSLIEAIQTDYDWVKIHTRLQVRALEWERAEYDNSFLLHGTDLKQAENWLAESVSKEPVPTLRQTRYIQASRQSEVKRQRRLLLSVAGALGITIVLGVLAVINGQRASQNALALATQVGIAEDQKTLAEQQKAIAVENAHMAHIRELTAVSQQGETRYDIALLLGLESYDSLKNYQTTDNLFKLADSNPRVLSITPHETVYALAVSPDGKTLVSGGDDGSVVLWDLTHGPLQQRTKRYLRGFVRGLDFSSDGNKLAVAMDRGGAGGIVILDAHTLGTQDAREIPGGKTSAVAFSGDNSILASLTDTETNNETIQFWDAATLDPIDQITGGFGMNIGEVAYSPDGRFLAAVSGSLKTVDVASGQVIADLMEGDNTVLCAAISPDGRILATAGEDNHITFWETENFTQIGESFGEASSAIKAIAFSPDGSTLAAGSWDTSIRFYDTASRELVRELPNLHKGRINDIAYSLDGKTLFSSSEDGTIIQWNLDSNGVAANKLRSAEGGTSPGNIMRGESAGRGNLSRFGSRLAVFNDDRTSLTINDVNSGELVGKPLGGGTQPISHVAFSPDGKILASADDSGTVALWDISKGEQIGSQPGMYDCGGVCFDIIMAFSPDGKTMATTTTDPESTITLWDVPSAAVREQPLAVDIPLVTALAFSPDGRSLAVGYRDGTYLFDLESHQRTSTPLHVHSDVVSSIAFAPNGGLFATAGGGTIAFWEPGTMTMVGKPVAAFNDYVTKLAFSPDGTLLASIGNNNTLTIWDVASRKPLGEPILLPEAEGFVDIAFGEDGNRLISVQGDGTVYSWDVSPAALKENLCEKVGRNFTQEEWALYFPDEPYHNTCEQWPEGE